MTLQNRVTPFGDIVAVASRGTLMGNRGCLHNERRQIVKASARDPWLICRLVWKDIRRPVMTPGKYTELFFLDEATALAAGHRPCNYCCSERLDEFKAAWSRGVDGTSGGATLLVSRIDPVLKRDRWERPGVQRRYVARLGELPDGVMVQLPGEESDARLKWRGRLLKWTPSGYENPRSGDPTLEVSVLTPACTVKAIAAGYVPELRSTAESA
jgi:hypothetical protein